MISRKFELPFLARLADCEAIFCPNWPSFVTVGPTAATKFVPKLILTCAVISSEGTHRVPALSWRSLLLCFYFYFDANFVLMVTKVLNGAKMVANSFAMRLRRVDGSNIFGLKFRAAYY